MAYDPTRDALFVGTSGAFSGGTNVGDAWTETAGYGDRMVELDPSLDVVDSQHPADIPDHMDLDLVGSPLVIDDSPCGSLLVQVDKDDTVYAWNADDISAGPVWEVPLQTYDVHDPFLTNLAWSASQSALVAVSGTQVVRISLAGCSASVGWADQLGTATENGSPTISGGTAWFAVNGADLLVGYDLEIGKRVFAAPLDGTTVEAPTIVGNRLVVGTFAGVVDGFSFGKPGITTTASEPPVSTVVATSWSGTKLGWQSRADGVYATTNGGKSWAEIYSGPARAVLRLSKTAGVISTGFAPGSCMCATKQLYTVDSGKTWHETKTLGSSFLAAGGHVYFWEGASLHLLGALPKTGTARLASTELATATGGAVVGAVASDGHLVAAVSSRVNGQGYDTQPRVIVASGSSTQTLTLPAQTGRPLLTGISAKGSTVTVTATDFTVEPAQTVTWVSTDGGETWAVG